MAIRLTEGNSGVLAALLVGEPDQAMSIKRVRGTLGAVEGKMDAFRLADRNHLGVKLKRALPILNFLVRYSLRLMPSFGMIGFN